ncbi:unnamed protein product [Cylindrotheca closterium]|uniref:Uncharacterized protein n=1 Tax=Cylindrotheca closterium TaxID=2856 RepID=A0AAD2CER5_9STRA|nr:unnamed protein product [Cylindrotheca closterium]
MSSMGYRLTTVMGLKQLKAPKEDGTEQDLEDFLTSLTDKAIIRWADGGDVGYNVEENAEPEIKESDSLTAAEESDARKVKAYERLMDKYEDRKDAFWTNTIAMFQLIMSNVTTTMRNKIKLTDGHLVASKNKDLVWLMSTVDVCVPPKGLETQSPAEPRRPAEPTRRWSLEEMKVVCERPEEAVGSLF